MGDEGLSGSGVTDDTLAAAFTRLSDDSLAAIARDGWGISPTAVRRLATERDDSAVVEHAGGSVVLKVAHPLDDAQVLDLQVRALVHAADHDPGLPLPRLLPDVEGSLLRLVAGADAETRRARVLTYLPGSVLDYATTDSRQRRHLGRAAGRLSLALSELDHPASRRVLAWDLARVGTLRPLLDHVADADARAAVERELDCFDTGVGAALAVTRQQVVHHDFHADNLLVDPTAATFVTGILDFGDVVRSSVVGDLAVAMSYAVGCDGALERHHLDPWAAPYDLASGFIEVRTLHDGEVALLPDLVRLRLAQRLLLNSWLAASDPSNAAYTGRTITRAGQALRRLAAAPSPLEREGS